MRGCSGVGCGCFGGHAWLLEGGMHGCSGGACMVALGVCMVALGGMVAPGGMRGYSGGHVWLLQRGMCGCYGGHAWLLLGGCAWNTTRYGDTVNEWAVPILLECILVFHCNL